MKIKREITSGPLTAVQVKSELFNEAMSIKLEEIFFDCDDCGNMFKSEASLLEHKKLHELQSFECSSCDFTSSDEQSLRGHIFSQHLGNKEISLAIPEKESISDFFFDHHIKMEPEHNETLSLGPIPAEKTIEVPLPTKRYDYFFCKICEKEYDSKRKLHNHITNVHEKTPATFKCLFCEKMFVKRSQLTFHLQAPLTGGFDCTFCDYKSKCKPNMTNHFTEKHSATCRFPCETCGEQFQTIDDLHSHTKENHRRIPRRFECDFCGRKYGKKATLRTHLEVHYASEILKCDHCNYRNINKINLKSHIHRRHMVSHELPCGICGKKFKMKQDVKRHVKLVHSDDPPAICGICGQSTKNQILLKSHMAYYHATGAMKERYTCRICGKLYHRKRVFETHVRSHTGEKPFSCPVCGKNFKCGGVLQNHILLHIGRRLFTCNVCGESFTQKSQLRKHRMKHPGPLPPLPVVKIKEIIDEFLQQFRAQQSS